MSNPSRFLQHRTQTVILISEDDGRSWHEYARRFDDYWEAQAHAIDIQVVTQKLLMMKLEMVETYFLENFEARFGNDELEPVDYFAALKDFAETHPGVPIQAERPGRDGPENLDGDCEQCRAFNDGIAACIKVVVERHVAEISRAHVFKETSISKSDLDKIFIELGADLAQLRRDTL
jgi:hypothetical protein